VLMKKLSSQLRLCQAGSRDFRLDDYIDFKGQFYANDSISAIFLYSMYVPHCMPTQEIVTKVEADMISGPTAAT